MSRKHQTATRQTRRKSRTMRFLHRGLGNLSFVALGAGVLFVLLALGTIAPVVSPVFASGIGTNGTTDGRPKGTIQTTCGLPGLPACPPTESWIPLRSSSPADIIAAAQRSTLFHLDRSKGGDHLQDISHLGTPQLVQALHVAGKAAAPDYFVIPIHDVAGKQTIGSAELQLNPTRTAVMVMAIITYTKPYAANSLTQMTPSTAVGAVQAQHHLAMRSAAQPRLVYYPGDPELNAKATVPLDGQSPAEPVWAVPGADGQDHIVTPDGSAHFPSELPIMAA